MVKLMSIREIARQGLGEGWNLWRRESSNEAAMDRALLGVREQAEPRLAAVAEFARQLARQSPNPGDVYRVALRQVAEGVSADLAPMAGLALAVWNASEADAATKEPLGQELLGKLDAPFPGEATSVLGVLQANPSVTGAQAELARAMAELPLDEPAARGGLVRTALSGGDLSDQVHSLRDKLRVLHAELALADGPFEGVAEALGARPYEEQLVALWEAVARLRALDEGASPIRRARAVAEAVPGVDRLLWSNLGEKQPLIARWAERGTGTWDDLERLGDSLGFGAATAAQPARVRETAGFVDIGPVRLARRSGTRQGEVAPAGRPPERFVRAALRPALDACPASPQGPVGAGIFRRALGKLGGVSDSKARAVLSVAAVVAGERMEAARSEASAISDPRTRALYTLAAAHAGSPERSRAVFEAADATAAPGSHALAAAMAEAPEWAHNLASKLEGGACPETRATLTLAAALAGSEEAARAAYATAVSLANGSRSEVRSVFYLGAAIAGSRSTQANSEALGACWSTFDAPQEGGYRAETRALLFLAAAVAGSPERSGQAFQLALEAEGGQSAEARAYYAIAAAAALNPAGRHLAAAVFFSATGQTRPRA